MSVSFSNAGLSIILKLGHVNIVFVAAYHVVEVSVRTAVHVILSVRNNEVALIYGVSSVVVGFGLKQELQRVYETLCGDRFAVFPFEIFSQRNFPRSRGFAVVDAPLRTDVVSADVDGIARSHIGYYNVSVFRRVIVESVETACGIVLYDRIGIRLIDVRVPVGREYAQRSVVAVSAHAFFVFTTDKGCAEGRHQANAQQSGNDYLCCSLHL